MLHPIVFVRSFLLLALITPLTDAEELSFSPRIITGYINWRLHQPGYPGGLADANINLNLPTLGIGATVNWGRFYLDAYGQTTGEASSTYHPVPGRSIRYKGYRRDVSIALGTEVTDNLSVYVGYRFGQVDAKANWETKSQIKIREQGCCFLGANYAWPIGDNGVVSLNVSYAWLNGYYSISIPIINNYNDPRGDVEGLSYGISWQAPLSEHWSYSIGLDDYSYKWSHSADKVGLAPNPSQDMWEGRLSISYDF